MAMWETFGAEYLRSRGMVPREHLNKILKPMSMPQAAAYLKREYSIENTADEIIDQLNAKIENQYKFSVQLKPHVLLFLQKLRQAGVKMCVATATDRYLVEMALERLDVIRFFEFILTCTEIGSGKDKPDIFKEACRKLGTDKSKTIVFEDSIHAIVTAKAAGFRVIGVHDASAHADADNIRLIADAYISDFSQSEKLF
jgi:HAD superfamily hydrolase (TIGR01509 family)